MLRRRFNESKDYKTILEGWSSDSTKVTKSSTEKLFNSLFENVNSVKEVYVMSKYQSDCPQYLNEDYDWCEVFDEVTDSDGDKTYFAIDFLDKPYKVVEVEFTPKMRSAMSEVPWSL